MSAVVPSPVSARAGVRRLALPALCAALLAGPMVALPLLAGPALAEAPAEQVAEVTTDVAPDALVAPAADVVVVPEPAADAAAAPAPTPAPTKVPDRATISPVGPDRDDDPGVGPVPDDVERPDLVLEVDGPASGWAGGEGAYTMSVGNAPSATAPAGGFTLVYTVPPGQTVLSVDAPHDSDWACVLGDQASCTWSGELAAGEQAAPVTVLVGHGRRATGRLTGTAQVSHLDGEVVLADNTASVVTAMEVPDLELDVSAPAAAAAGETLSMVLSVTNVGPGWISRFALHGDVSDGVTVNDLSGPGFACDVAALSCQYDDALAPGLSAAVTLTGVVDAAHAGGPMTTSLQVDQAAVLASALTSVSAAKPAAAAPVVAAPPAAVPAAAPAKAAPVAPVRAVTPIAVRRARTPLPAISLPAVAQPTGSQPATLPFTDTPSTLAFTGSRSGSQLGGGVALLLLGGVLTVAGRRRRTAQL